MLFQQISVNRSQDKFLQTMPCQHTQQFIKYSKKTQIKHNNNKKHLKYDIHVIHYKNVGS